MVNIFRDKLDKSTRKNGSKIILALDLSVEFKQIDKASWNIKKQLLAKEAINVINKVGDKIAGIKINRQLILTLGLYDHLPNIIDAVDKFGLPAIADCKINDVGHTNEWITRHYLNAGFDAVIANPFIGWDMGLDKIFEVSKEFNTGVILLVYMSHKGAAEGYGQEIINPGDGSKTLQYLEFARRANQYKVDGVIVGSTAPDKIREVSRILNKDIYIFSPGVGTQGGDLEKTFSAGTSYVIIGRSIFKAPNPDEIVLNLNDKIKKITQVE
jgi:orotidine-5'-phosphate decarboxylase